MNISESLKKIDSELNTQKRSRIVGMVLPKNAVSVEDTKLKIKSMTQLCLCKTKLEYTKFFRKNVFLSALILSNVFIVEHAFALSVQPIQVKSALGEPFRAQMIITDIAGVDPSTIHASLANDDEFIQLGISKRNLANDLHFSTSITSPERGVITITSDRPLNEPYIEFVVHIGFGRNVRLQQVTALVDPPLTRIQTESLNLPIKKIELAEASQSPTPPTMQQPITYNKPNIVKVISTVSSRTVQLIPSTDTPPSMEESPSVTQTITPKLTSINQPLIPKISAPPPMSGSVSDFAQAAPVIEPTPIAQIPVQTNAPIQAPAPVQVPALTQGATPIQANAPVVAAPTQSVSENPLPTSPAIQSTPVEPTETAQKEQKSYTVQRHDSLWVIASRMQKEMDLPVTVIMHSIQQNNRSAFIHGNPNHIRSGATIILPNHQDISESVQTSLQPIKVENDDIENNKTPIIRSQSQQANEAKTPYVRRGHLPDAKMTLVAPAQEGNAQGSVSEGQSDTKQRELSELNLKITTARQQNLTLSQEVSDLVDKIKFNDQKLALQNAKLAELMQRLKKRKDAAPQNANRMQDHE
jgi:Tfp pilus assembly protein FimV